MPKIIKKDDNKTKKIEKPKFFHKKLTGSGKGSGVLHKQCTLHNTHSVREKDIKKYGRQRIASEVKSKDVSTILIPIAPVAPLIVKAIPYTASMPSLDECIQITDTLYSYVDIDTILITKKHDQNGSIQSTEHLLLYSVYMFDVQDATNQTAFNVDDLVTPAIPTNVTTPNTQSIYYCTNPLETITKIAKQLGVSNIDTQGITDKLTATLVYTRVCQAYDLWQGDLVDNVVALITGAWNTDLPELQKATTSIVRSLTQYNMPLESYTLLYNALQRQLPKDVLNVLCDYNQLLALTNNLNALNQVRDQIPTVPNTGPIPATSHPWSIDQQKIITCDAPLQIVQAGAGTGKSTTLMGRIDYLISMGIQPADIMVLSFTNTAADNIRNKRPGIESMTIAMMCTKTYQTFYPAQIPAEPETIANLLRIHFANNSLANELANQLEVLHTARGGSISQHINALSTLIRHNFENTMTLLNIIGVTCLDIQTIVCYLLIDKMSSTPLYTSRFIIIDEVQDTSVFEFTYFLKYAAKYHCNLTLVGDCAQTLYEFRASDPRMLNTLESSGIFALNKLSTNYRSREEILMFVNGLLQDISVNRFAQIQLRSARFVETTIDSFKNTIQYRHDTLSAGSEPLTALRTVMMTDIQRYVHNCLTKKEQVCLLASSKRELNVMMAALESMFPNTPIHSLTSDRAFANTILTKFILNYWDDVKAFAPLRFLDELERHVKKNLYSLTKVNPGTEDAVTRMFVKLKTERKQFMDTLAVCYVNNTITQTQFLDEIQKMLTSYEMTENRIRQSLLQSRNEQKKTSVGPDSPIVISTIHSAKGLEFPHVVAVVDTKQLKKEEKKQMYYVALTRAIQSEFVYSYGTTDDTLLSMRYNLLLDEIESKSKPAPMVPGFDDLQHATV